METLLDDMFVMGVKNFILTIPHIARSPYQWPLSYYPHYKDFALSTFIGNISSLLAKALALLLLSNHLFVGKY